MMITPITPPSPEEILPRWLEELQATDRTKGTIRCYGGAVKGFPAWYSHKEQQPLTFSKLTPIVLIGYRNYVQRTQHRATSTMNGQISALRSFCAWFTEERYLEVNPVKRLKLVGRQEAFSCEGLNDTQVYALLCQARSSRDSLRNYAIVQMLLQTSMRWDECSQLTLDDIELGKRSRQVTIRRSKGNRACVVPLNASACQALAEYIALRLNCDPTIKAVARDWPVRSSDGPSIPLCLSQKKGILTTSVMRQIIDVLVRNTAARTLVLAQTSVHTLRHTFAHNYLAEYPDDIVGLVGLLGHTSLDTTRIYSQPTIEQLSARVE